MSTINMIYEKRTCAILGGGDSIHIFFSSMSEKYNKTAQGKLLAVSIVEWTDRALSKLEGVNDILLSDPDTFAACNLQKLCPGNLDKCS